MLKREDARNKGSNSNPFTPDDVVSDKAFSRMAVYHDGPWVVVESFGLPPVRITWYEALKRVQAIAHAVGKNRTNEDQKLIEDALAAIREARKQDQKEWRPPESVSMYIEKRPPPTVSGPWHKGVPKN